MQHIITSDDILDGLEAHTEETMAVVRSWYYFVRRKDKEIERELGLELRAAIGTVTGLQPNEIIIDF